MAKLFETFEAESTLNFGFRTQFVEPIQERHRPVIVLKENQPSLRH